MPFFLDKRLDEFELRLARLEKWLDAVKEHADRGPSASDAPSELPLAKRVDRLEQALVSAINFDVRERSA